MSSPQVPIFEQITQGVPLIIKLLQETPEYVSYILFICHCLLVHLGRVQSRTVVTNRSYFKNFVLSTFATTSGATLYQLLNKQFPPSWMSHDPTIIIIVVTFWFINNSDFIRYSVGSWIFYYPMLFAQYLIGAKAIFAGIQLTLETYSSSTNTCFYIATLAGVAGGTGGLWFASLETKLRSDIIGTKSPLSNSKNRYVTVALCSSILYLILISNPQILSPSNIPFMDTLTPALSFFTPFFSKIDSFMTITVPQINYIGNGRNVVLDKIAAPLAARITLLYFLLSHGIAILLDSPTFHLFGFMTPILNLISYNPLGVSNSSPTLTLKKTKNQSGNSSKTNPSKVGKPLPVAKSSKKAKKSQVQPSSSVLQKDARNHELNKHSGGKILKTRPLPEPVNKPPTPTDEKHKEPGFAEKYLKLKRSTKKNK